MKVIRLVGGVPSTRPADTRWVTKQAAEYLKPKWVLSDDQGGEPEKKTVAAVPVASQDERLQQIRAQYVELAGEAVHKDYMEFNQARLFVEISNLKKAHVQEPVEAKIETAPKKVKVKREKEPVE